MHLFGLKLDLVLDRVLGRIAESVLLYLWFGFKQSVNLEPKQVLFKQNEESTDCLEFYSW